VTFGHCEVPKRRSVIFSKLLCSRPRLSNKKKERKKESRGWYNNVYKLLVPLSFVKQKKARKKERKMWFIHCFCDISDECIIIIIIHLLLLLLHQQPRSQGSRGSHSLLWLFSIFLINFLLSSYYYVPQVLKCVPNSISLYPIYSLLVLLLYLR